MPPAVQQAAAERKGLVGPPLGACNRLEMGWEMVGWSGGWEKAGPWPPKGGVAAAGLAKGPGWAPGQGSGEIRIAREGGGEGRS